ncbi:MAG: hypothetical protein ACLT8L_01670 [Streptococcus salivarius]
MFQEKLLVGDLIYITVNPTNERVLVVNVSRGMLSDEVLTKIFGEDRIKEALSRLIPKVKMIASLGYHPNSKGKGKISPKRCWRYTREFARYHNQ